MSNQLEDSNRDILEVRAVHIEGFLARIEDMVSNGCIKLKNAIDLVLELASDSIIPESKLDEVIFDWVDKIEETEMIQEVCNKEDSNNPKLKKA